MSIDSHLLNSHLVFYCLFVKFVELFIRKPKPTKIKPNTEVDVECTIPGDALLQASPRPVTRR